MTRRNESNPPPQKSGPMAANYSHCPIFALSVVQLYTVVFRVALVQVYKLSNHDDVIFFLIKSGRRKTNTAAKHYIRFG